MVMKQNLDKMELFLMEEASVGKVYDDGFIRVYYNGEESEPESSPTPESMFTKFTKCIAAEIKLAYHPRCLHTSCWRSYLFESYGDLIFRLC